MLFAVRCLLFAAAAHPGRLAAQQPVAAVVLDRRSIFDPDESSFWLLKLVNRLHITTLPYVIRREILQRVGEPYDRSEERRVGKECLP